jgi:hypothetical protein
MTRHARLRVFEHRKTLAPKLPRSLTVFISFTLGDGKGVVVPVQVPYETHWFESSEIQAHVVGVVASDGDRA